MIMRLLLDLPCEAAYVALCRSLAETLLRRMGVISEDIDDVQLILGEVCANAVQHAYDDPQERYQVNLQVSRSQVDVIVNDHGKGANPALWNRDPAEMRERGRGMHLVRALADGVEWRVENGTTVHAIVHLHYENAWREAEATRMDGAGTTLSLDLGSEQRDLPADAG